ncbi:hypothetical protein SAMD00019534_069480 [Acytostelium subglobosum LB1]|uniref:hypothetical protein n=1 Tax=Acytostelium subglobosum LB1 TaxID=1410327 RepID=UPI0006448783|nr:hypothetical protein SAMD00019534_069480 [Acytostelium subglobosum LB1]GAM23773.1 hypothetical protein SAMD00019534_069480 [Acytostelium subglobosum LB1]|eukprot:XP_012753514.1 hypothetical protein SAMD00019534_069480 [Acytostelium subglobosum LB1]
MRYLLSLIALILVYEALTISGQAQLTLPCIIRDLTPQKNPDFEVDNPNIVIPSLVKRLLGNNRKPVYCCDDQLSAYGVIHNQTTFGSWFNNVQNVNIPIQMKLNLTQNLTDPNIYNFRDDHFFPINGLGWDAPGADPNHVFYKDADGAVQNFHFCLELHARFTYKGGEIFRFIGDDDVWLYIDGNLVLDLGGPHLPAEGLVSLDNITGLTVGQDHSFDFFYCERHTTQSHMMISTSMELKCGYTDYCGICEGNGSYCCNDYICNDNNPCTIDMCPPPNTPLPPGATEFQKSMCIHKPKECAGGSACVESICNIYSPTGECFQEPKVCIKPCMQGQCTEGAGGCTFIDLCPNSTCKTKIGCSISNNSCIYEARDCDDANACTQDLCDDSVGCRHIQKRCVDGDPCTNDLCDVKTGDCVFEPIPLCKPCGNSSSCVAKDLCTKVECDPNNADKCIESKLCDDHNSCTEDSCDANGNCTFIPKCSSTDPCFSTTCNETVGECVTIALMSCDDQNPCTADTCSKGVCANTPIDCDDNNPCTVDKCDAARGGCQHVEIVCEDKDACNLGKCNVQTGTCETQPLNCTTPNFCITAVCDVGAGGCIQYNKTCVPDNPSCQKSVCNFDKQECQSSDYDPLPFKCQPAAVKAGVAVGAAAIAGIVIGCIAALALAAFGGVKGYDAWKQSQQNKMSVSSDNPLYQPNPNQGTNPLYTGGGPN